MHVCIHVGVDLSLRFGPLGFPGGPKPPLNTQLRPCFPAFDSGGFEVSMLGPSGEHAGALKITQHPEAGIRRNRCRAVDFGPMAPCAKPCEREVRPPSKQVPKQT